MCLGCCIAALAGCTRLTRVEFTSFSPTPTVDSVSGVRIRPAPWATVDITGGSRMDLTFEESRPISQVGVRIGSGKVALIGRLDYLLPDDFAGFIAMEVEW